MSPANTTVDVTALAAAAMAAGYPMLLSARQLGKLAGCSEAQVNRLRRAGGLPPELVHESTADTAKGHKYSLVQAVRWLAGEPLIESTVQQPVAPRPLGATRRPSTPSPDPPPGTPTPAPAGRGWAPTPTT